VAAFEGHVALITGAASGIGRATALLLASEGASVAVADVDRSGADVAKEMGDGALFIHLDVSDEQQWRDAIAAAASKFGRLDVLVNNAGVTTSKPIVELTLDEWRRVMAVNLDGAFLGMTHAIPAIRAGRRGGAIVNVSSASSIVAAPGAAAYCASKAALTMLTKVAALECASDRIRVNSVHPGGVRTPMWRTNDWWEAHVARAGGEDAAFAALARDTPLRRMAEPDEIARAILYLASAESSFITGSEFVIDGGYTA
jgi:NAD(P)-dependent dehydrogenase (short-subunit alcohol dehydrogenase family)